MTDTYSVPTALRNSTSNTAPVEPSTLSMTDREVLLDPDGVAVRGAIIDDGALLWELARDAGGVDLNTPYAYMMKCRNFHETCAVAEVFGTPAGFVTAHRVPKRPQVLFVWQVAVLPEFRGLGIGQRLLEGVGRKEHVAPLQGPEFGIGVAGSSHKQSRAQHRGSSDPVQQMSKRMGGKHGR